MFEDSLMESTRHFSKRRGWMIMLSSGMQAAALAVLVVLPLLHTDAISSQPHGFFPVIAITAPSTAGNHPPEGNTDSGGMTRPIPINPAGPIPHGWIRDPGREGPPVARNVNVCPNGDCGTIGIPGGWDNRVSTPLPPKPSERRPITSKFDPGQIIFQVKPVYPRLAIETRIQWPVSLHALIGRDGLIENLQVVSGHPWLVKAALDAVSQWRFRPYILNGQPIEVETEITVNFTLDGAGH